jgi:hypothetical protein
MYHLQHTHKHTHLQHTHKHTHLQHTHTHTHTHTRWCITKNLFSTWLMSLFASSFSRLLPMYCDSTTSLKMLLREVLLCTLSPLKTLAFWALFARVVSWCVAHCEKSCKDRVVIRRFPVSLFVWSTVWWSLIISWRLVGVLLQTATEHNSWSSRFWSCNCWTFQEPNLLDPDPWRRVEVFGTRDNDRKEIPGAAWPRQW